MNKLIPLALVASLILALAACQEQQPASTGDNSWDYVKNKGELIVGLDDTFAPMGFRDEQNTIVGFDVDMAAEVCARLGVKAVFQPIDWDAKEMELAGKRIDVIWNGLSITEAREKVMLFTKPYLDNKIIIMTKPGVSLGSKEALKGLKIGTQAKSAALEVIMADPVYADIKDSISEYKSYDDALMDLEIGRLDVLVIDEVLGMYKNAKKNNLFGVSAVNFGKDEYGIGFRLADKALRDQVEAAMEAMKADGKAAAISTTWFGKDIVVR